MVKEYQLDRELCLQFLNSQKDLLLQRVHESIEAQPKAPPPVEERAVERPAAEDATTLEVPEQEAVRKKSGFGGGLKSMLNHLTKGRPKPKRGPNNVCDTHVAYRASEFSPILGEIG
jgi:hypothetical protein